jgi:flagellar basal body-associated protein FliL
MGHESLLNYYKTNFALMQHHKYSIAELEEMIPFERDIYIMLLSQHIQQENERIHQQQLQQKMRGRK